MVVNQNAEQKARDNIDKMLINAGWVIQNKNEIDWSKGLGIAVREYQTDSGPADYVLFVDREACGVVEAKKEDEGFRLHVHEDQTQGYAESKLKFVSNDKPLRFLYETTGIRTQFKDMEDPKPRAREIFSFHQPRTLQKWLEDEKSLRAGLLDIPDLDPKGLRECQINAISNLEKSFKANRPRALIQMATGSGKTFTAATFTYRLLKYAKAKRILFLVDTKNLGEQAEQEFRAFIPTDDNRSFADIYPVQRLQKSFVPSDVKVCISTIQRMYSILKGEELDESLEETSQHEQRVKSKEPLPVVYNYNVPIEMFDFIVIDECHRSIYDTWRQVLDYFDSFLIGLTATPDKRTFAFFKENVVSEYTYEQAVADGVNVSHDIYTIETEITAKGEKIKANQYVEKRDKLSRKKRWEMQDEDLEYNAKQLDDKVVNPSQIRTVIRTFRDQLPEIFPGRKEVPKTLIFAKTDSHADDIITTVREEFGEASDFCKKITYKIKEDPKSVLASFRNDYNPRIAVTVDMIATGTDVKPIECLLFMRDVKSRNYFEQMKGRGTRTLGYDDLKSVTPSAKTAKTHFVIVDAIGVTKSLKTDSRPLERKKSEPLKNLLYSVLMGVNDEDTSLSLAGRLARLNKEMSETDKEKFKDLAKGNSINTVIHGLLDSFDPDKIEDRARNKFQLEASTEPNEEQKQEAQKEIIRETQNYFSGELNDYILEVRRELDQIIDNENLDTVQYAGWDVKAKEKSEAQIIEFKEFLEKYKDEILALKIYYSEPYRIKEVTHKMIKDVLDILKKEKHHLAPLHVYQAYTKLDEVEDDTQPLSDLTALVALIRRITGLDQEIKPFKKVVDKNFQRWVFKKQEGSLKFNPEQMEWLRMAKEHIASSFHIEKEDLDYSPFDSKGGLAKMYDLFGEQMQVIMDELNEELVA